MSFITVFCRAISTSTVCSFVVLFGEGTAAVASPQENAKGLAPESVSAFENDVDQLHGALGSPGLAVAVVHGGELSWFRGLGYADVDGKVPVTRDTPFHLASLTKTFASTVVLDLVEQGLVDLDKPMLEYGIDLSISGLKLESAHTVTPRHLLSHTAEGIPGEHYRYNGSLFSALSALIEKVTGRSFNDVARTLIIDPLALKNTGNSFDQTQVKLASPYRLEHGKLVLGKYPESYSAAAGMIASAADLAAYSCALDDLKFLEAKTAKLAFSPTVSNGGTKLPYGLGWFAEDRAGTRLIWHYGNWDCISSLILKVPEFDLTLIALSNTDHLSRGFGLGAGSVLTSPLALSFLRAFQIAPAPVQIGTVIDWSGTEDELASALQAAPPDAREFLMNELWSRLLLSSSMADRDSLTRLFSAHAKATRCEPLAAMKGHPIIARILDVGANANLSHEFSLEKATKVRIVAAGEAGGSGLVDYAWIENVESQETTWSMNLDNTEPGGGSEINRIFNGKISLPAGFYRLRYKSDQGHNASGWGALPPDGHYWGATLFGTERTIEEAKELAADPWEWIDDPADEGYSLAKLEAAEKRSEGMSTAAFVVVVGGRILFEWGQVEEKFKVHSCRKSFMSALYGNYVEGGLIDLNQTLAELEIDDSPPLTELEKTATVEHCLQARSGVYHSALAESQGMKSLKPDRHSHAPGTHWYYNNWDFNVLHTIFEKQTQQDFYEALERDVMRPIGAHFTAADGRLSTGEASRHAAYHLVMSARDMARFGHLMLRGGRWKGKQVIPSNWVSASTSYRSDAALYDADGYGYMWWVSEEGNRYPHLPLVDLGAGAFSARGAGGHYLLVLPEHDMVIVHRVNTFISGNRVSRAGVGLLAKMVLDAKVEIADEVSDKPANIDFEPYVGRYEIEGEEFEILREGGRLFLKGMDRSKDELLPGALHEFYSLVFDAKVVFSVEQDSNKSSGFVLSGLGQSYVGTRVE